MFSGLEGVGFIKKRRLLPLSYCTDSRNIEITLLTVTDHSGIVADFRGSM
jgi:hypothetical protein